MKPRFLSPNRRRAGFSLLELLIITAIIGIIAAIAVPNFRRARAAANQASAVQTLRVYHQAEFQVNEGKSFVTDFQSLQQRTGALDPVLFALPNAAQKSGYVFVIAPGVLPAAAGLDVEQPPGSGLFPAYHIQASPIASSGPQQTGLVFYYLDHRGTIHAKYGAPATSADAGLSQGR